MDRENILNGAMDTDKQTILEFIHGYDLCVISTASEEGSPQSALVGFSETDSFELLIGTPSTSRKYANIKANPAVSVVIGWSDGISVQYEGTARELENGEERADYLQNHFTKLPGAKRFKDNPEQCYIVIKPKWLRYTDTNLSPRRVTEITF